MKTSLRLQRLVAGTMGFLFFGTHCLFAYSTESNIWSDRRKSREHRSSPTLMASLPVALSSPLSSSPWPSLQSGGVSLSPTVAHAVPKGFLKDHQELLSALSPAFGTIRKVSLSPQSNRSTPVVIHIQDVHQNLDAQKNIGRMVDSLLTTKQAGLIALEGTWGDIQLQPFRDFPHRQAVELSADYLLKENKISGPIHAILTGTGPLPSLIGVDDSTHYNANVEAYRESAPLIEATKRIIDQRKAVLDLEKSRVFTPELKAMDSAVEAYRSGQLGLGDYVNTLTNASPELVIPSAVLHFKKTLLMEKTMDFKQVERERADLIGHLVQKLNHQEMDDLTRQSVAYRSNQVSYGDFYSYLQALCHRTGVSLETYPAMQTYVRYVLLADGIQAETLLEDLTTLERNVFSTMAHTSEARALIEESRVVHLTRKLVDFSLTPEEWSEYLSLRGKAEITTDLGSFEAFYQEAEFRDKAMAKNLIQAIGASGNSVSAAILVTGGYHSPGLIAQLTQAGATVISVVPKIEKVETSQGISYLSVFAQEKTPLEELFVGEKLFLAQHPISQSTRQIFAPTLMVLTTVLLGYAAGTVDLNTMYHSLGGLGTLSNLVSSVPGIVSLSLSVGGAFFIAKAMGDQKNGIENLSLTPRSRWGNPLKGVVSTLKKHMAPILLSLSMSQSGMASPSIPTSFSTHSLENASQLTSFMMNYLPAELKSVVFFIGFYSSYGWVMAGIALLMGFISFGYRRIHAALKKIESYRSAGNISKLLGLWKENEWARERILIALRTLPLDKLSLHRGEVIVTLLGTPGMSKKESIRVDQFIEILNVTPQEIGMHLLRGGLVGESSVYLNRASPDQLLVYKGELISIVSSEPTAQSVFAARILIQRLNMSPREVCIPLLENNRFYESHAQIDFVSPEEYQRFKREVQKEREIRQGFNRMKEKLGIEDLWNRIIAKDKSVIVDLILLLPKAKWTESRWEGEGPEGVDGWGFGTLHEVKYPVNVESDILEIIEWVGPATATEIPALCQLLNGSPEIVSNTAKKVLNEVEDTPENISKAYEQVVKEHPADSESSQFAPAQIRAQSMVRSRMGAETAVPPLIPSETLRITEPLLREMGPAPRILSVGANGNDESIMAMGYPGARIQGITMSENDLNQARRLAAERNLSDRISISVHDMRKGLLAEDGSIDLIYARLSLHYLTAAEAQSVFLEIKRILAPGGKVVIVVKSDQDYWAQHSTAQFDPETKLTSYTELTAGRSTTNKRRYFSESELLNDVGEAGLVPLSPFISSREKLYTDEHTSDLLTLVVENPTLNQATQGASILERKSSKRGPTQGDKLKTSAKFTKTTGRATSRWMTRLIEGVGYLLGGKEGREKAGKHYTDHAPIYEWTLGLTGMFVNFGVILFFSGSGLAGVVAPLLGAVFGGLFFVSHFGKTPKTLINVSVSNAAVMAFIYTALIIITPFPLLEFLEYRSFVSVFLLSVVASWWAGALVLHRHFDRKRSPSNREKPHYSPLNSKSDEHFWLKNFLSYEYELEIRKVELDLPSGEVRPGEKSYRVYARSGEVFVFRNVGESLSAARSFISTQMNLLPKGKVDHPFIRHVRHYDEKLSEDPFIILWEGVRWSLERFEEREEVPPQRDVLNKLTKQTDGTGRATSLWGVKLAEVLFGKRFGVERAGAVYKLLAPLVGTGLALGTVALGWGGVAILDGSAVAGVVAPLVGAVFGGIFIMSHYLLPNSWLPKSLSRKDINFPNVLTMTILYATSITLSLWGIFGVETLGLTSQEIRAIALISWPAALLTHGFFDGLFRPFKKRVSDLSASPLWRSPLGNVFGLFLVLVPFLLVGEPSLGGSLAIGGAASGVVGFLPLLFGSMIHQGGPPSSRAPFGQLTVVANVMDVGSYFHGNSVLYERSLPKIKKLLPEYAEMGATEIYLTNGLFTPSEMGKKVHTVPPASPIIIYAGKAISMLGGSYFTKRKWLNGTWFDDRHGSNFSTTDMRVLNPDAFDSTTNEGRWAELAEFVAEVRRFGMKVKVDLVPWISPDGITKDNWTWAKYHQKVPEEDRSLSDEKILEKHPGNSLVKWEENGQSVRVLVGNFSPGVDQVDPDFNNSGYQAYLMDYLHRLINSGVESVRVDMAHRLGSLWPNNGWQAWTKVINDAKSYAKEKGQTFHFLMEAYPEGGPDWRGPFLDRFPQEAVYHADPFHNYERIAKGEGEGLMHLKQAMEHARSHPGQWWAFPTNFDEWSLKNMGGPQEAFLALLLIYARLGVPLMVDSRELMGQAGQNIPQAGGQDRDKEGNFRHPFPNVIVRGFRAFWGIFRQSPRRRFLLDMKSFLAEAETIEILDTPNEHRYFAVGIKNRSGAYDVRVWDFYPGWGTPTPWVEAPKSFLSNESVALRWKETEKIRTRRLRNAFVMTDPSLPGGQAPLNLMTVTHGTQKWHRFPIVFGPGHVARLTVRPISSGRPHRIPRARVRGPDLRVFPGATFRLVMNTPLFRDGGESRIDFQRVENILTLDGNNIPFTSTALTRNPQLSARTETKKAGFFTNKKVQVVAGTTDKLFCEGKRPDFFVESRDSTGDFGLNEVRGPPPEIDRSNILALLPNGNLGMNDWFVGFANGTFYHKPREDWEHRTYDMLVQPVEGAPRVQTLRFRLVKGSWKAFDATTNKEETPTIAYAVFGQRIVKDGKNNVENLAEQFDDLRHLFRFPLFELPGNRQWHLGFNDDRGELYEDRQKVTAALKGQSVTLSLKPLHELEISDTERDSVFTAWGYVRRQTETTSIDLKPGDYVVSSDLTSLTVNLLPGIHPHSFIGLSQTGELMAGLVPGQTHHEGISVNELANRVLASGAKELFLWANGKDAKIVGTAFTGEAEKARPGYLAAIAIERPTSSRSSGSEIAVSSTHEPQRVASMVLSELGQRPLNRGVGEFMDRAARLTVEKYSERVTEKSIFPTFPWVEEGQGTQVLFVDAESVRTAAQRENLSALVAGRSNWAIITNSKDLSAPGIDSRFVFSRPEVFPDIKNKEDVPLGIREVLLAKLGDVFRAITEAGNGASLRFMHTSVIRLNPEGLTDEQNNIRDAADRAWLLNTLFQFTLPARSLDWKGIIETLTAISHNA